MLSKNLIDLAAAASLPALELLLALERGLALAAALHFVELRLAQAALGLAILAALATAAALAAGPCSSAIICFADAVP